jgi:hypothetical protein
MAVIPSMTGGELGPVGGRSEMSTAATLSFSMSCFADPLAVACPWASSATASKNRPGPAGMPVTRALH